LVLILPCAYISSLSPHLHKGSTNIQLLGNSKGGSGLSAPLADGIASVRQIEDTLLECKANLTSLFEKAFQTWSSHASSTGPPSRSNVIVTSIASAVYQVSFATLFIRSTGGGRSNMNKSQKLLETKQQEVHVNFAFLEFSGMT
jgi:hypothetical protein